MLCQNWLLQFAFMFICSSAPVQNMCAASLSCLSAPVRQFKTCVQLRFHVYLLQCASSKHVCTRTIELLIMCKGTYKKNRFCCCKPSFYKNIIDIQLRMSRFVNIRNVCIYSTVLEE